MKEADLILNGWILDGRGLQSIPQSFIIQQQVFWPGRGFDRIPVVNQFIFFFDRDHSTYLLIRKLKYIRVKVMLPLSRQEGLSWGLETAEIRVVSDSSTVTF